MRLLLVEDEKKVASFIQKGLGEEGHAVDWASDEEEGLYMGLNVVYDLIILDVNLPAKDGLTIGSFLSRPIATASLYAISSRAISSTSLASSTSVGGRCQVLLKLAVRALMSALLI
jgi:DNA-binding response OmpR family regulator